MRPAPPLTARPLTVPPLAALPRTPVPLTVLLLVLGMVLLTGCSSTPEVLLVPTEPPDGDHAAVAEDVPADFPACAAEVSFDESPEVTASWQLPYGWTVTVEGTRGDNPLSYTCDYTEEGDLVAVDPLASTGTDQPVGNDYVARVGGVLGRVDIGIPDEAETAIYDVVEWTLTFEVEGERTLRLHALAGGSAEEGFQMGIVTFLDADGQDITPESVELPDVIHGVPRDTGSAAETD